MSGQTWQDWHLVDAPALAGRELPAADQLPTGVPRLALHGWLDNADSMTPLLTQLHGGDGARSLSLDLPGHGFSSHSEAHVHAPFYDHVDALLRVAQRWTGAQQSGQPGQPGLG